MSILIYVSTYMCIVYNMYLCLYVYVSVVSLILFTYWLEKMNDRLEEKLLFLYGSFEYKKLVCWSIYLSTYLSSIYILSIYKILDLSQMHIFSRSHKIKFSEAYMLCLSLNNIKCCLKSILSFSLITNF